MLLATLLIILHVTTAVKKNQIERWGKKYDFIIIGGGTAGSVLASRLSEVKKWKILVLEAGQQPPFLSAVPSMAQNLQLTAYNWGYLTEPQENIFKGLNNQKMLWSSGRVLGGGSSINYMIYERGNPEDYNQWEKMGNRRWSYKDVLPYFLKSEKSQLYSDGDSKYHNEKGLMNVEFSYSSDTSLSFLRAATEMGYNITDYNGRDQIGFSHLQGTTKKGGRQTTANAFLEPFLNRTNLEVVLLAEAVKIQFNSTHKKATAVHFIKGTKTYKVTASKEIILSAGTFNSPKLLMLSGIGPEKSLRQLNIKPIIKNLPVGQILRDHVTYPGLNFITNRTSSSFETIRNYILGFPGWYFTGSGSYSTLSNFEAVGFVNVDDSSSKRPNVELLFLNSYIRSSDKSIMNVKDEVFEKLYEGTRDNITWSIYPTLLSAKSKGKLQLKSKQPQELLLLYPNYFTHPEDLQTMIKAIKFVLKMTKTPEFKRMGVVLNPNPVPGCEVPKKESDAYWECAIRTLTTTGYDPFGTCKMGMSNDTESVVDDRFKVHGIKNLRVIDASVFPETLSARLMASVVMIAERGADFIKESHKK